MKDFLKEKISGFEIIDHAFDFGLTSTPRHTTAYQLIHCVVDLHFVLPISL